MYALPILYNHTPVEKLIVLTSQRSTVFRSFCIIIIIIIIIASYCYKKSYSVHIKYYSKQGEKIMVLVRILMSKS
jgi:hypothetical protein